MNRLDVLQNFVKVEKDPWPHLIIEDALPIEIHDELLQTLPDAKMDQQEGKDKHNKKVWLLQDLHLENFPVSDIWKEFINYHTSTEFFYKVLDIFSDFQSSLPIKQDMISLVDRSKEIEEQQNCNCFTDFSYVKHPTENNVCNRTPHTDNEKEIYAGLLYLKHPYDNSTGGDFAIHKAKSLAMDINRTYHEPGPVVKTVPYKSNNFVMFWNGIDTQHSVTPRQNAEYPRWSINMIGRWTGSRNWRYIPEAKA